MQQAVLSAIRGERIKTNKKKNERNKTMKKVITAIVAIIMMAIITSTTTACQSGYRNGIISDVADNSMGELVSVIAIADKAVAKIEDSDHEIMIGGRYIHGCGSPYLYATGCGDLAECGRFITTDGHVFVFDCSGLGFCRRTGEGMGITMCNGTMYMQMGNMWLDIFTGEPTCLWVFDRR